MNSGDDRTDEEVEHGMKAVDSRTEVWFGEQSKEIMNRHNTFLEMHYRALACHCECLGMNAENMWAAIANQNPVYTSNHYYQIMQKWGLINEKGESLM